MNADLNARVVLDTDAMAWLATDGARGGCKLLDCVDAEGAQATSVVRCAPGCALEPPGQGLGEEILVLEGTLAEGQARYSAGAYLRDPAMPGLQKAAQREGRGLWAQKRAVQPWKWRYDCWRQRQCDAAQ